jgi:hypothetical protein
MKRKITLLICIVALAISAKATNAYNYTFEDAATTPNTLITGTNVTAGSLQVVTNDVTDGIDNTGKCLTFTAGSVDWWEGIFVNVPSTTTDANMRYLYIKVRASSSFNTNFMIDLFQGTTDLYKYFGAVPATMLDQTWKEYCYMIPAGQTFNNVRIQPRHSGTYFIDDIRLSNVAPNIPNLTPFTTDFESEGSSVGWASNFTGKGATYRTDVNTVPYNTATVLNTSAKCMRIWMENGAWADYGGGRYTGLYGYTTADTRYLHVRYFYLPNNATSYPSLPLWVFTEDGDSHFTSTTNAKNQWTDVTIDLGVGTLVKYLNFTLEGSWITAGIDDIVLNGDPNSRNFTSAYQSGSIEPKVGERAISYGGAKATSSTTWFSEHYKLTFPGTRITWALNMPSDYTVGYSTTINGRTITGTSVNGANSLDLYGIKGQTTAQMTFTYTPTASNTTGSAFTETQNATLAYFGSSDLTDNGVNIGTIGTVLYKSGQAVASVPAIDNKTGGYVPSYYAPMKSTSTSDDATFTNYSNDVHLFLLRAVGNCQ